ncbi:MAG TPA: hypothetical protein VGM58_04730 [Verrucomicrobiae bacterium]|jgi:hypothetical protein
MVVKTSITFLTADSDALLIIDTNTIMTMMTGNASYPAPSPMLAPVKAALNDFSTSLANAADGGLTLTSLKNDKRAVLVALLRELANYVQSACNGDLTVLMSSGFPIQKPQRFPIGVLPAPNNLVVTPGALTGELNAAVQPVFGAAIYNWRLAAASAPDVVLQTAQTTAASTTFSGLTPGIVYIIQANAVGSAGPSDWSNPVSKMVV